MTHQPTDGASSQESLAPSIAEQEAPESSVASVGELTRQLHRILQELGYYPSIEDAANAGAGIQRGIRYVSQMGEAAATKTLDAIDAVMPVQQRLESEAMRIGKTLRTTIGESRGGDEARWFSQELLVFVECARSSARSTREQLIEIAMAQEFQDLTGQVLRGLGAAIQQVEQELLRLLVDQASRDNRQNLRKQGLLNGPAIDSNATDSLASQQQVDELLQNLGF